MDWMDGACKYKSQTKKRQTHSYRNIGTRRVRWHNDFTMIWIIDFYVLLLLFLAQNLISLFIKWDIIHMLCRSIWHRHVRLFTLDGLLLFCSFEGVSFSCELFVCLLDFWYNSTHFALNSTSPSHHFMFNLLAPNPSLSLRRYCVKRLLSRMRRENTEYPHSQI